MRIEWQEISGVAVHASSVHVDSRGNFVKLWNEPGLSIDQVCTSFNKRRGTVRGLHVQVPPATERKLVWCLSGRLLDVLVDTRADQPTYGQWTGIELSAAEPALLEVPAGVAHGYQTLEDSTSVGYLISGIHDPQSARTLAWDDSALGIDWPLEVTEMSANDRNGRRWPPS